MKKLLMLFMGTVILASCTVSKMSPEMTSLLLSQNAAKNEQKKGDGLAKNEPYKQVEGLGSTALEHTILRWNVTSRPKGADLFWSIVSSTPDVKSTNDNYLETTPFQGTKTLDIRGLTYENSGNVRIIIICDKEGYGRQRKEFNLRELIDQGEVSALFNLTPINE